jgi:hypothetical protein
VSAAAPERLPEMLGRLKLGAIRDRLDTLPDEDEERRSSSARAQPGRCPAAAARGRGRAARRIPMGMGIARFPFVRTLESFAFEARPSLDPRPVSELATGRPAPPLAALASRTEPPKAAGSPTATRCCCSGRPGWARRASPWVWGARRSGSAARCCSCRRRRCSPRSPGRRSEGRLEEKLGHFAKPKLPIIDELGSLPFEPNAAHLFFLLVSHRPTN